MDRISYVHLAIDCDSEPISGSVAAVGERPRQFSGWIELVEVIEEARQGSGGPRSHDRRTNGAVAKD